MSRSLRTPLVAALLLVGCESADRRADAPPPAPAGEAAPVPGAAAAAPAADAGRPVPAEGASGYAPEYHPEARGLLERMEESLKPLESVPSKTSTGDLTP